MLPLLAVAFVLSGAAGLIYEAIWTRYLSLFVGHSAYAQVIVLVIFLGGMAFGAFRAGAWSQRLRAPLLGYAVVELTVAVLGLSFHSIFLAVTGAAYERWFPSLAGGAGLLAAKWALASLLILAPSILLGATFPLMSAGVLRLRGIRPGHALGLLYFANSLGAAVGVLLEGFWLVGSVGLEGTLRVAALLNVVVAMGVGALWWWTVREASSGEPGARAVPPEVTTADLGVPVGLEGVALAPLQRVLLAVSALTALSSFVYEIGWIRMLSLVLGSATHSFELMLSAFILGLALGAYWIRRRIDDDPRPLRTLGIVQWAMGVLAIATLPVYLASFGWVAALLDTFRATDAGYRGFALTRYALALAVMLPATFCAGMTLPLITRALLAAGGGERSIGRVYGVNTLGSIVGVALGALVLLPLIGLKAMLILAGLIDVAVGVALVLWDRRLRPGRESRLAPRGALGPVGVWTAATLVLVAVIAMTARFDRSILMSGVYRYGRVPEPGSVPYLFHRDGRTASVGVRRASSDTGSMLTLSTNGKPDASLAQLWRWPFDPARPLETLRADMSTQVLIPLVALAHKPQARTAVVIGHGSGITSHYLLGSPALDTLYTVEIEPEIIAASRHFLPANRRAYEDPRSVFVVDDAKSFLAASGRRFELILSEPSNPWVSGVSGLFTVEFYERIRAQLTPDGVFGQWLHLYEIDDRLVTSVLAAIDQVFPAYEVFLTSNVDILIVATPASRLADPDWGLMRLPSMQEDLRRAIPLYDEQLEVMRMGGRELLSPFLRIEGIPNSDFEPILDLGTERTRFRRDFAHGWARLGDERLDIAAAFAGRRRGFGTALRSAIPDVKRVEGLGTGAELRRRRYGTAAGIVDTIRSATGVDDDRRREALHRLESFERWIGSDVAPARWELWATELETVERDLHAGTAGVADERFFADVRGYLSRTAAPRGLHLAVDYLHGLAAWDFRRAADAADSLVERQGRREQWIPPERLREGVALAHLMVGEPERAGAAMAAMAPHVEGVPSVRDRILAALVLSRSRAMVDTVKVR